MYSGTIRQWLWSTYVIHYMVFKIQTIIQKAPLCMGVGGQCHSIYGNTSRYCVISTYPVAPLRLPTLLSTLIDIWKHFLLLCGLYIPVYPTL